MVLCELNTFWEGCCQLNSVLRIYVANHHGGSTFREITAHLDADSISATLITKKKIKNCEKSHCGLLPAKRSKKFRQTHSDTGRVKRYTRFVY